MSTVTITIKQRIDSYLESNTSDTLTYRVMTYVSGISDDSGGTPNLTRNLFLFKKRSDSSEYISQSDYMRIANAEDFSMIDQDTATNVGIDTYNGERLTWEDIETNGWIGTYVTANPHLSTAASGTSPAGYYVSNILVDTFETLTEAKTHATNILIILDKFAERYNLLSDNFETDNATTYPYGYEEIVYS